MRKSLLTAVLAAGVALSGAAFAAATSVVGTIKALDLSKHQVTLEDGTVYMLPTTFKDPGLKVGEKVTVSWKMVGTRHEIETILPAR